MLANVAVVVVKFLVPAGSPLDGLKLTSPSSACPDGPQLDTDSALGGYWATSGTQASSPGTGDTRKTGSGSLGLSSPSRVPCPQQTFSPHEHFGNAHLDELALGAARDVLFTVAVSRAMNYDWSVLSTPSPPPDPWQQWAYHFLSLWARASHGPIFFA